MQLFVGLLWAQPLLPGSAPLQDPHEIKPCSGILTGAVMVLGASRDLSQLCSPGWPVFHAGEACHQACPYTVILSGPLGKRNVSSQQLCAAEIPPTMALPAQDYFSLWEQGLELCALNRQRAGLDWILGRNSAL